MDDIDIAGLLASQSKESGAWLHALPIYAMGLQLDFSWEPLCAALINANIVERRWMLWAAMGLAVGGVRGYMTNILL